jgi:p-aminobenzoyl-glutamate transporter AbgT
MATSPSAKLSVNFSSSCVNCRRSSSVTAGLVVVNGLARMLYTSVRFHPFVSFFW